MAPNFARKVVFVLIVSAVLLSFGITQASAQVSEVNECGIIDEAGDYELVDSADFEENQDTCLEIRGDGVTLDGNGVTVAGMDEGTVEQNASGVLVNGTDREVFDITVTNVSVEDWESGEGEEDAAGIRVVDINETERRDGVLVSDSIADGNDVGVSVENSEDVGVAETEVDGNNIGIGLYDTDSVDLSGNYADSNSRAGILLDSSEDNIIVGNDFVGNGDFALSVETFSSGNQITNNSVERGQIGIQVRRASDNELEGNEVIDANDVGVSVTSSSESNQLVSNTVNDSTGAGISMSSSPGNELVDNELYNNGVGIGMTGSDNNTISGNTAERHSVDQAESAGVSLVSSDDNSISDNALNNNDIGLSVESSSGNNITDNTAENNEGVDGDGNDIGDGVLLRESNDNTVGNNYLIDNSRTGINLEDSSNNTVESNTVEGSDFFGITVLDGSVNTLTDNNVTGNQEAGITLAESTDNNTVGSNTVRDNGAGILPQLSATDNELLNNTVTDNEVGVSVQSFADNNHLAANTVNANNVGIAFGDSSDNTVVNNTVHDNADFAVGIDTEEDFVNSTGNDFVNLNIGDSTAPNTTVSFGAENVTVDAVDEVSDNQDADDPTERYLEVETTGEGAFVNAEFGYDEGNLGDFVDSLSLSVWREDNADDWTELDSRVDTDNETVSAELTDSATFGVFGDPSFFQVSISNTNEPVEGDELEVEATVTNFEDGAGERDIALNIDGDETDAIEDVRLEPSGQEGDEEELTLVWDTEEGDAGEYTAEVSSGDDEDTEEVQVLEVAFFDVEIIGTNSPIDEGEVLQVLAEVTNMGGVSSTQKVNLTDFGGDVVDSKEVTLDSGSSDEFSFAWGTGIGDAGEGDIAVSSKDDEDTEAVEITQPQGALFNVEIDDTNSPVNVGDELEAEVTVENSGDETGETEIALTDFGGDVVDTENVELGARRSETTTLRWTPVEEDIGDGQVTVSVENEDVDDDQDTAEVTVLEQGVVASCSSIDESGSYQLSGNVDADGGCIEITANDVEFDGQENRIKGADNFAVLVQEAQNVTVTNVSVEESGIGLATVASDDVSLSGNSITDTGQQGVVVQDQSSNINVTDNSIAGGGIGVFVQVSEADVVQNDVSQMSQVGIASAAMEGGEISQNVMLGNEVGIALIQASNQNTLSENVLEENAIGVALGDSSNNQLTDNIARNNTDWDITVDLGILGEDFEGESSGNRFTDLNLGDSTAPNTTVSFGGELVNIGGVESPSDAPNDNESIGRYFEAEANGEGAVLSDVEVSYEDGDISLIDEGSLALFRNGESWEALESSVEGGAVTVDEVTEFGTFGVFGEEVEEPLFDVEIDETNEPVTEGDELVVNGTVSNEGNVQGEQTLNLSEFGDIEVDNETFELNEGEQQDFSLTWETEQGDAGMGDVTVSSEDDTDTATVEVEEAVEAVFNVEVDGTNEPVTEGETLLVNYTVTNTGDLDGTQEVNLTDLNADEVDSEEFSLSGGETASTTLLWETQQGDAGTGELTVSSEDNSDSTNVTVEELPDEPFFEVEITGTNEPVTEGETLDVDVEVVNTGDGEDTQELSLSDFDGETVDNQDVTLGTTEGTDITLSWGTSEGDAGTGEVSVSSLNDTDTATVTVEDESDIVAVDSCTTIESSGEYELTGDITSDQTCIEITADGVSLDGGGFSVTGDEAGNGEYGVHVSDAVDVEVEDVSATGWDGSGGAGVRLDNAENVDVSDVTVTSNFFGVLIEGTSDSRIQEGFVESNTEGGIVLDSSSDNRIADIEVTDNGVRGIAIGGSSESNSLTRNTVSENPEGVFVTGSSGNSLDSNTVEANQEAGVLIVDSSEVQVVNNKIEANERGVTFTGQSDDGSIVSNDIVENDEGVVLVESSENTLSDNMVTGNADGIRLDASQDNEVVFNDVQANDVGISVERFSSGNSVSENTVTGSSDWEFSVADSTDNVFDRNNIGESTRPETVVSFEAEEVNVGRTTEPPEDPDNVTSIGRYFDAEANDGGAVLDIEVGYTQDDLGSAEEGTLELRKYDGTQWSAVDSNLDSAENTVSAEIDEFSTFGVFGEVESLLQVEILEVSQSVTAGDTVEVEAEVTNTGVEDEEAQVALLDFEGVEVDTTVVQVGPEDTATVSLEWDTTEDDIGTGEVTVTTDDDTDTAPVTVRASDGAYFDIESISSNDTVLAGDSATVEATVTNIGDREGVQQVRLEESTSEIDSSNVSLEPDDTENVSLVWETNETDIGEAELTVLTDNTSESVTVEVVEPQAFFGVEITDTNEPVVEGDSLEVGYEVTNTGDGEGEQDIILTDAAGETLDTETVSLGEEDSLNDTLVWVTEIGDAGTETLELSSDDDTDTETVTVEEAGEAGDVENIELVLDSQHLRDGGETTATVTATLTDGSQTDVTDEAEFETSDTGVISLGSDGIVTAVGTGEATVTAVLEEEDRVFTDEAEVTVQSIDSIELQLSSNRISFGDIEDETSSVEVTATLADGTRIDVTDDAELTVSEGIVTVDGATVATTGEGSGTTVLTAELSNEEDTAEITVLRVEDTEIQGTVATTVVSEFVREVSFETDTDIHGENVTTSETDRVEDEVPDGVEESTVVTVETTNEVNDALIDGFATVTVATKFSDLTGVDSTDDFMQNGIVLRDRPDRGGYEELEPQDEDVRRIERDGDELVVEVRLDGFSTRTVVIGTTAVRTPTSIPGIGGMDTSGSGISEPEFTVSGATTSTTTATVDEEVGFSATVEMTGGSDETTEIELSVDGEVVDTRTVSLIRGESTQVDFKHSFDTEGVYEVEIDGVFVANIEVEAEDKGMDETDEADEPDTPEDVEDTGEEEVTEDDEDEVDTNDESEEEDEDGEGLPGFGVLAAVVALLAVILIAARTDSS